MNEKGGENVLAEERFERILTIIEDRGSVSVQQLMTELDASESTIRRDLNSLDGNGLLTKVHGGAVARKQQIHTHDEEISSRKLLNADEKRRIAKYAAGLIRSEDFVYIDAGTTTEMMIDFIECREAVFVTDAIGHAKRLAGRGFQVYILGGEFKSVTEAIVGEEAVAALGKYNFTKGFWGTNGVTAVNGFTTPEIKEAMVKKKSMQNCKERYVLADSSKFSRISSIKFAEFDAAVILTTELRQKAYQKYKNIVEVK